MSVYGPIGTSKYSGAKYPQLLGINAIVIVLILPALVVEWLTQNLILWLYYYIHLNVTVNSAGTLIKFGSKDNLYTMSCRPGQ